MRKHDWVSGKILAAAVMLCLLTGCAGGSAGNIGGFGGEAEKSAEAGDNSTGEEAAENTAGAEDAGGRAAEKNGEVCVLYTSDVHCGVEKGFGFAGLYEYKKSLEAQGYTTILVDDGDAVQGETIGTLTQGEAMIRLMNVMEYDVAIPGNHEFDYGAEQFLKLADMADFPYISCNVGKEGELLFDPYVIIEAAGKKIGFVGMTTPETMITSTPDLFQDENGNFVYGFLQDGDGTALYQAVQDAVDAARADGAEYVYAIAHLGMEKSSEPYTYADVISHTNGIDVLLDGHSHDAEQVVMKNKDGTEVVRSAVGTKLSCIGYSFITDEGIQETDILSWPNDQALPSMIKMDNPITAAIAEEKEALGGILDQQVGKAETALTVNDPEEMNKDGTPVRMIRRAETNLGDFAADVLRVMGQADIGIINGGALRETLPKGNITYGDLLTVFPFSNHICVIEVTGQQLLDALEWGARGIPEENGAFLQVSGLTLEIDSSAASTCIADENGMMLGVKGERRVRNVRFDGKPIDPDGTYTVAGVDYVLLENGDGQTAFDGARVINSDCGLDIDVLISYITNHLEGTIGEEYADLYGQGRIVITE